MQLPGPRLPETPAAQAEAPSWGSRPCLALVGQLGVALEGRRVGVHRKEGTALDGESRLGAWPTHPPTGLPLSPKNPGHSGHKPSHGFCALPWSRDSSARFVDGESEAQLFR